MVAPPVNKIPLSKNSVSVPGFSALIREDDSYRELGSVGNRRFEEHVKVTGWQEMPFPDQNTG